MTTPAFNEADHKRVADGTFTTKGQSSPEIAIAEAARTPAADAYAAAQTEYFRSGSRLLEANVAAMREYVAEIAPEVAKVEFSYFGDVDGDSLDYTRAFDADGNELELNVAIEDDLRDYLDELGDDFTDGDDVKGQDFDRVRDGGLEDRWTLEINPEHKQSAFRARSEIRDLDETIARLQSAKHAAAAAGLEAAVTGIPGIAEATIAHVNVNHDGLYEVVALSGNNDDNASWDVWEVDTDDGHELAGTDFADDFNLLLAAIDQSDFDTTPSAHPDADFYIQIRQP